MGFLKNYLLSNLQNEEYAIRQKAYVLFWLNVVIAFLVLAAIVYNVLNPSPLSAYINIINVIMMVITVVALVFLKKGYYNIATGIVIVAFTFIWSAGMLFKTAIFVETGTNSFVYLIFPLLIIVSMFGGRFSLICVAGVTTGVYTFHFILAALHSNSTIFQTILVSSVNIYLSIVVVFAFSSLISFITAQALKKTEQELEEKRVLNLTLESKVLKRTQAIKDAMVELENLNNNLRKVNGELESAQRIMSLDMKMAVNVQQSFLPNKPDEVADWEIAYAFRPMSGVSGDLYDFYTSGNSLAGVSIFDVSGHGIASGLITMIAKSVLYRNFVKDGNRDLSQILKDSHLELVTELENVDNYLTGIMLRFDGRGFEYVNAAHNDLMFRDFSSGEVFELVENGERNKGTFLGMGLMDGDYPVMRSTANSGDAILLYTDCLNESTNRRNEQYGCERILSSFKSVSVQADANEYLTRVVDDFESFIDEKKLRDDLTVIVLKKR